MAVAGGAGPRANCARAGTGSDEVDRGWANVGPVHGGTAAAMGQWVGLLASISHELRTPLNAVIGFSDAMQEEVFGPIGHSRYREYVQHIRASGVELLRAAEDALAMTAVLAQPRDVVLGDVGLSALVAEAVADLGGSERAGRCTITAAIPDDIEVRGDRHILPRAIRQLLAVAISRAAPGSLVEVGIEIEQGLVDLVVEVAAPVAGAPPLVAHAVPHGRELGLGRQELAMWLALALLDLLDCRLVVETREPALRLRTTLEQSVQGSFFAGQCPALA